MSRVADTAPPGADEDAARVAVALRLADEIEVIERGDPAAALAHAERLNPAAWAKIAHRTGSAEGYTPSPYTISAAITVLRDRVTAPDPFAGFG